MKYTWDTERRRYIDEDGNVVSEARVRDWIGDFAAVLAVIFAERAGRVLSDYEASKLDLDTLTAWYAATRKDLQDAHRAATVIAFGGRPQMSDDEWNVAEPVIDFQLGFWENFAAGVFVGTVLLDGNFAARTGMYGDAVYSTYENAVRVREQRAGMDEERRVLGSADHCEDCILEASFGWSSIGTRRAIGDSRCRSRCKCRFEFRKRPTI